MFNFIWILEKIFTGFAVDADTKLVKTMAEEGNEEVFVVKKSAYYITLFSWFQRVLVWLIAGANIFLFLVTRHFPNEIAWLLGWLLLLNLVLRFGSICRYLYRYTHTYNVLKIMPSVDWVSVLQRGDKLFRSFFNQTVWLLFVYVLIIAIFAGSVISLVTTTKTIGFNTVIVLGANILLFFWQFAQIVFLLRKFIDLEMDFVLITKDTIKACNQRGRWLETKTMEVEKVKTIKSVKTGFLRSILNYGDVNIYTEWDSAGDPDLALQHVLKPEALEKLLQDIKKL